MSTKILPHGTFFVPGKPCKTLIRQKNLKKIEKKIDLQNLSTFIVMDKGACPNSVYYLEVPMNKLHMHSTYSRTCMYTYINVQV